ncbi:MAG TPA: hypothetical protein VHU13_04900, partial [Solirubrobacteraceae bacterium]|nr:hypothetical protein [Solirubrobacteraceae bacterium]
MFPTNLAPSGGTGTIEDNVYSVGADKSTGTVTVTDVLPAGVVATEAGDLQAGEQETIGEGNLWECTGNAPGEAPRKSTKFAPATVVTCTNNLERLPQLPPSPTAAEMRENGTTAGYGAIEHIGIAVKSETNETETLANQVTVTGGGASAPSRTSAPITISPSPASVFGFQGVDGWFSRATGTPDTQAGSHPYSLSFSFDLDNTIKPPLGALEPAGGEARDLAVNLPPGFIGNPTAVPGCTRQQFEEEACSPSTQIGIDVPDGPGGKPIPEHTYPSVYNLVPPPGVPAQFGLKVAGIDVYLDAGVRSGGDYGITVHVNNITEKQITGNRIIIWGEPSDPSHDEYRYSQYGANGTCNPVLEEHRSEKAKSGCSTSAPRVPFITLPT